MIIETKLFKESCNQILKAAAKSELTPITETLELKTAKVEPNNYLLLSVTNRDYFVSVKFAMQHEEEFHATVNASTFLKLIGQITSDTVELKCTEKYLSIKANGSYKIPLIFKEDKLLDLPAITIENRLAEFDIDTTILKSIVKYNSRRVAKKIYAQDIQASYYIDQEGCITFSKGACWNKFELPQPVKFLLSDSVVKLFKLFEGEKVHFTLGCDPLTDTLMQTKVSFENEAISLTAITPNANIESMPAEAVRAAAKGSYPHTVMLNREALLQALNRLSVLSNDSKFVYGIFTMSVDELIIEDLSKTNSEVLKYQDGSMVRTEYKFVQELNTLRQLLSDWSEEYINLMCGSNMTIIKRGASVVDVLPEVIMNMEL